MKKPRPTYINQSPPRPGGANCGGCDKCKAISCNLEAYIQCGPDKSCYGGMHEDNCTKEIETDGECGYCEGDGCKACSAQYLPLEKPWAVEEVGPYIHIYCTKEHHTRQFGFMCRCNPTLLDGDRRLISHHCEHCEHRCSHHVKH